MVENALNEDRWMFQAYDFSILLLFFYFQSLLTFKP
jgi:hypothetical protein